MQKSSPITMLLCVGTVILAPVYWFIEALKSWGGPGDDIAIIYILFLPILIHGMTIAEYGIKRTAIRSLVYFLVIAILCIVRHFEVSGRSGYDHWHANRSLESLVWTLPWFAVGLVVSLLFKPTKKTNAEHVMDVNRP